MQLPPLRAAAKPPLTHDHKAYLFAGLLRLPDLFIQAQRLLTSQDFPRHDAAWLCVWKAAQEVARRNLGHLPTDPSDCRLQVEAEARQIVSSDPFAVPDQYQVYLFGNVDSPLADGWFDWAFTSASMHPKGRDYILSVLRDYLTELTISEPLKVAMLSPLPQDVSGLLERLNQQRVSVSTIGRSPSFQVAPEGWQLQKLTITPTGVAFLDHFMGGGSASGEVYAVSGLSGGGKTILGVQLSVEGTLLEQQRAAVENRAPGYWYYISYETPVADDSLRRRVIAYAATIGECELYNTDTLSSSARGDYKDYEMKLWPGIHSLVDGIALPGEQERFHAAMAQIGRKGIDLIDFTGYVPGLGEGGVNELACFLETEKRRRKIAGVVIDYMGIACTRQNEASGGRPGDEYSLMARFIDQVRTKIALPMDCCVWVFAQYKGDNAKRKPGSALHYSDASGTRNLADNASFAFDIGPMDHDSRLAFGCSKQRRAAKMPPIIIKMDGNTRRFIWDRDFIVGPGGRSIVHHSMGARIVAAAAAEEDPGPRGKGMRKPDPAMGLDGK